MSQKYIKSQNKNSHNAKSYGKYYAKPVYDEDGNIVKRVTSADSNDIEDPESSLTPNPSPTGEGSGNTGGNNNGGGGDELGDPDEN